MISLTWCHKQKFDKSLSNLPRSTIGADHIGEVQVSHLALKLYELVGRDPARPFSPFVWRTRMALAHKGLTFERVPWRFTESDVIAAYGAQKVPVLIDGPKAIADSWVIFEYLEDAYPEGQSLFGGQGGRAIARMLNWWSDLVVVGGLFPMIVGDIPQHLEKVDAAYFVESRTARLGKPLDEVIAGRDAALPVFRENLQPMRATLETQLFLGGAAPTYADYIVFGPLMWARTVSPLRVLTEDDPIYAWRERLLDAFDGMARSTPSFPS